MELSLRCPTRRSSTSSTDEARPHNERNGLLATVNALKPDHSVGPVPAQPCLRPVLREPLWRTLEMLQQPKGRRRSAGKRIHALQIGRTTQGPVPQEDISPWRVFVPLRHDPSPSPLIVSVDFPSVRRAHSSTGIAIALSKRLTIIRRERGQTNLVDIFVPRHWQCLRAGWR
jgi:hypothetical protein